jgi:hypothetical protein
MRIRRSITALVVLTLSLLGSLATGAAADVGPDMTHNSVDPGMTHN